MQRTAVVLRYYEQLEYAEIADLTGVREGSVRARVSRGIAALRVSMGDAMSDLESRLAEVLRSESESAPEATGLADAARSRRAPGGVPAWRPSAPRP